MYDEDYFLRGEGSNYGGEYAPFTAKHYIPIAAKRALGLIETFHPRNVLDVGCGRGFLVSQLRLMGGALLALITACLMW